MACILHFAVSISQAVDVSHHVRRFSKRVMTVDSSLCCQAFVVASYRALLPVIPAYSAAKSHREPREVQSVGSQLC